MQREVRAGKQQIDKQHHRWQIIPITKEIDSLGILKHIVYDLRPFDTDVVT